MNSTRHLLVNMQQTVIGLTGAFIAGVYGSTHMAVKAADMEMHGTFLKAEAPVTGTVKVYKSNGRSIVKLSNDFMTNDQAPDLKVVVSQRLAPLAESMPPAFPLKEGTYSIVAPLKSTNGMQEYVVPKGIDMSKQKSVLIWCKQFNATMAWAPLTK